ncbi:unknown [Acidaminococcus sp. CAG:917]|nr:unknown [Acidaminococcus sp. CAG:917]
MTSLQILATFSAFFTSLIAVLAPYTFLADIETSGASSHDVTATPMPSNKIEPRMRKISNNDMTIILPKDDVTSDIKLKKAASKKEMIVIFSHHRLRFFSFFFF